MWRRLEFWMAGSFPLVLQRSWKYACWVWPGDSSQILQVKFLYLEFLHFSRKCHSDVSKMRTWVLKPGWFILVFQSNPGTNLKSFRWNFYIWNFYIFLGNSILMFQRWRLEYWRLKTEGWRRWLWCWRMDVLILNLAGEIFISGYFHIFLGGCLTRHF